MQEAMAEALHEDPTGDPLTVTRRRAAEIIGMRYDDVKAATNRAVDPMPHIIVGKGTGKRVVKRVIVDQLPAWLEREAARSACPC